MRPSRSERPFDPSEYQPTHAPSQLPFNDLASLRIWLRGPLRAIIPHEAALCGLARRHALGHVPVRIVAEGLPDAYLTDLTAGGELIQCLALERWVECGVPQFISDQHGTDHQDIAASDQLRQHGLRNVAVAGYSDTDERLLSFFCLYNVQQTAPTSTAALMEMLAPLFHHALAENWTERAVTAPEMGTRSPMSDLDTGMIHLTRKEREVLEQVRHGHSNKQIGKLLNKSPLTVKTQVRSLLVKLQVPNRTALACQSADQTRHNDERQQGP